jgi:hypothetical protein
MGFDVLMDIFFVVILCSLGCGYRLTYERLRAKVVHTVGAPR